jgi:Flp pilus assembly protein TadG
MMRIANWIRRAWRREDGNATVEFVLAIPVLMTIFTASFESGLFMVRSIMLEQSLDMVMRELRLGHYVAPDAALLKTEVCKRTVIFPNCEANLTIELREVSTTTWALPTTTATCTDVTKNVQPVTALQIGQQNDLMLVRACIRLTAMFPTTGIGLGLNKDSQGAYGIIAISAFSNEPS